jgi:hypothetical protein
MTEVSLPGSFFDCRDESVVVDHSTPKSEAVEFFTTDPARGAE